MRLVRYACFTWTAAAVLGLSASPAFAQVDVRVKVDTRAMKDAAEQVVREVHTAIRSAFGPELRRDLQDVVRDLADSFGEFANTPWGSTGTQNQRFRATQTDRETRRFTLGGNGYLDLDTLSGDITVRRGSGRDVVVEIIRESRGTTDATAKAGLAEVRAISDHRGSRVTVRAEYPSRRGRSEYSVNVSYVVTAPADTHVSTKSISGDVSVEGIEGEVSVNCTSGDVRITDVSRLASATTASGDVTLLNVVSDGPIEASTLSGDILATTVKARRLMLSAISGSVTAKNVDAGDVKLNSVSDDVFFEGALTPRGRYEFTSHSGDVHITVDGRTGFSFDGSTFSGSVRSNLTLENARSETRGGRRSGDSTPRSLRGTFGDGSAVINANSFVGTISLTRR